MQVLLGAGTSAAHFDASFDSASSLDLCRLQLSDPNSELNPVASLAAPQRFAFQLVVEV